MILALDNSYVFATSSLKDKDRYRIIVPKKGNTKIKGKKDRLPNEVILQEFKDAIKKNEDEHTNEI
ncbi:hypothetical protein HPK19_00440 [Arthrobacter citreus]|nr:hypothetical protein HPK19_00440 [Arthrobacter citreus]